MRFRRGHLQPGRGTGSFGSRRWIGQRRTYRKRERLYPIRRTTRLSRSRAPADRIRERVRRLDVSRTWREGRVFRRVWHRRLKISPVRNVRRFGKASGSNRHTKGARPRRWNTQWLASVLGCNGNRRATLLLRYRLEKPELTSKCVLHSRTIAYGTGHMLR